MSKSLDRISLLETFVRISEAGSLSAAARDLGLSQPSVSRQLSDLEDRLKTQLVRRNTHSLALTDAGLELLTEARQLLDSWEALEERHLAEQSQIQGKLKIVAPIALGQLHLAKIVWEFQSLFPEVVINWELEDNPIRFAEVGCDCWIKIGPVPDDTLIVSSFGSVERIMVASDLFVKKYRLPKSPQEAQRLPLAALAPFEGDRIPLRNKAKKTISIRPKISMQTNNMFALKHAALMGLGMAVLPRWFITEELNNSKLVDILPDWRAPTLSINIAYLPGRHQTLRLRKFIEHLRVKIPNIEGVDPPG